MKLLRKIRLWWSKLRLRHARAAHYIYGADTLPQPLCAEEEAALMAKLSAGDTSVRETLIVRNLRLVVYIARKFENSGVGIEDLISNWPPILPAVSKTKF